MVFSGRFVDAKEALALGLIDEMVAPDGVYDAALAWARRFVELSAAGTGCRQGRLRPFRLPCYELRGLRHCRPMSPLTRLRNPHATAEQVEAARHDSKLAQVLYHDWEAESYDDKWSISYDKRCVDYARDLFDATVPEEEQREAALRPGAGAGLRQRVLPAQPDPGRGGAPRLGDRPVARAWSRWPPATARTWAWKSTAGSPTPRASRTRTTPSTSSSATPCCTTSPTSSCRCARWCGCSSPAAGSSSPASRPTPARTTPARCRR